MKTSQLVILFGATLTLTLPCRAQDVRQAEAAVLPEEETVLQSEETTETSSDEANAPQAAQPSPTDRPYAASLNTAAILPSSAVNGQSAAVMKHPRRLQRVNREVMKATFIPKGTWMVGGDISYSEYDSDNINFLVLKDINGEGYKLGVSPFGGYFFRNNMAAGLRYTYNRTYLDLDTFDLNLGEDFNISLDHLYWLEQKYEIGAFLRTYMPIGRSRIFGFFNDLRLTYGYTQGKNSTGSGSEYDGTFETANSLQIGFAPGLTAFITDYSAVEVSVGVMGFNVNWVDQKTNQVEKGSRCTASANFKINLFSIKIGMTFYL